MKSPELDERTAASLRRRLLAAPAAVRAIATAETVDWRAPDFQTDEAQQAAMNALLRACADARAAASGRQADGGLDDDGQDWAAPRLRRWAATERLSALSQAIAAAGRALRQLRQRGLKATIATIERDDGAGALVRAEMSFRLRSIVAPAGSRSFGEPLMAGDNR